MMESCGTVLVAFASVRAATSLSANWSLLSTAMSYSLGILLLKLSEKMLSDGRAD
jgi:hypothetical protein